MLKEIWNELNVEGKAAFFKKQQIVSVGGNEFWLQDVYSGKIIITKGFLFDKSLSNSVSVHREVYYYNNEHG